MKKILQLGLLVSLSINYAYANQTNEVTQTQTKRVGFFLAPAAGAMFSNGTGYHDSPEFTFSFGYSFSPYFSLKAGSILFYARSDDGNTSKLGSYLRADAIFSLPTKTKLTPYLLVGAGNLKLEGSEFAPNVGFGLAYGISKDYALTLNYRAIIPTKTDGMINIVDVGFIHYF
ncbi:porin family protein [Thiotrichales bacterium 19X7-9]|nr:porin family protein [Thiotrichales bacterium 19X7-9]